MIYITIFGNEELKEEYIIESLKKVAYSKMTNDCKEFYLIYEYDFDLYENIIHDSLHLSLKTLPETFIIENIKIIENYDYVFIHIKKDARSDIDKVLLTFKDIVDNNITGIHSNMNNDEDEIEEIKEKIIETNKTIEDLKKEINDYTESVEADEAEPELVEAEEADADAEAEPELVEAEEAVPALEEESDPEAESEAESESEAEVESEADAAELEKICQYNLEEDDRMYKSIMIAGNLTLCGILTLYVSTLAILTFTSYMYCDSTDHLIKVLHYDDL